MKWNGLFFFLIKKSKSKEVFLRSPLKIISIIVVSFKATNKLSYKVLRNIACLALLTHALMSYISKQLIIPFKKFRWLNSLRDYPYKSYIEYLHTLGVPINKEDILSIIMQISCKAFKPLTSINVNFDFKILRFIYSKR